MSKYSVSVLISVILLSTLGCASTSQRDVTKIPALSFDFIPPNTDALADLNIVLEDSEWWQLDGYKRQLPQWPSGHGWMHGPRCLPDFKIIATLSVPLKHPFIREDFDEKLKNERKLDEELNVHVVSMDFTPVTLRELEKEFLASALPRLRGRKEPSLCGWMY